MCGLLAASGCDWRWRKVPNSVNGAIAFVGLTLNAVEAGVGSLPASLLGMATGLGLMLAPFAIGLYKGGDVKLVIALGAWLGWQLTIWAVLYGVVLGGVIGVVMVAMMSREERAEVKERLGRAAATRTAPVAPDRDRKRRVPMAVAFSAGTLLTILGHGWRTR